VVEQLVVQLFQLPLHPAPFRLVSWRLVSPQRPPTFWFDLASEKFRPVTNQTHQLLAKVRPHLLRLGVPHVLATKAGRDFPILYLGQGRRKGVTAGAVGLVADGLHIATGRAGFVARPAPQLDRASAWAADALGPKVVAVGKENPSWTGGYSLPVWRDLGMFGPARHVEAGRWCPVLPLDACVALRAVVIRDPNQVLPSVVL
jgi:hypothetical protein